MRQQGRSKYEQKLLYVLERSPTDPRAYVTLGTHYIRQKRYHDAREVLAEGCRMAQGNNSYIWATMGHLEQRV